ncbi:hypothetical protein [uncultured Roseibium sp.]|uniref:hypothetical protein n=1 Tax=uncultured Roseibium sp. TaxID=1936171 RepID=UPI0026144F83|nr:hypothetical protein [uncultured Roseibium sp.]
MKLLFKIEYQRTLTDCSVCCAAMALREDYEDILQVAGTDEGWNGLKYDDVFEHFGFDMRPQPRVFRPSRPAILSVPSRINPLGYHAVYYERGRIFDPTRFALPYDLESALTAAVAFYQWWPEE